MGTVVAGSARTSVTYSAAIESAAMSDTGTGSLRLPRAFYARRRAEGSTKPTGVLYSATEPFGL